MTIAGVRAHAGAIGGRVNESCDIVAETARRIFADLGEPRTVNRLDDEGWKAELWRSLVEAELTDLFMDMP